MKEKEQDSNRVCTTLITDSEDNILMGFRKDKKKWTSPGGHCHVGECIFEGVIRELKEETGLDAIDVKLIKCSKKGKKIIYVFRVTVDQGQEFDLEKDPDKEFEKLEYVDPNEIKDKLYIPVEDNFVISAWLEE